MFDSFRTTMREGKVTDKHDVMSKLFSGMISSYTTIKYHAVFLNKTIQLFQLRREDSFKNKRFDCQVFVFI